MNFKVLKKVLLILTIVYMCVLNISFATVFDEEGTKNYTAQSKDGSVLISGKLTVKKMPTEGSDLWKYTFKPNPPKTQETDTLFTDVATPQELNKKIFSTHGLVWETASDPTNKNTAPVDPGILATHGTKDYSALSRDSTFPIDGKLTVNVIPNDGSNIYEYKFVPKAPYTKVTEKRYLDVAKPDELNKLIFADNGLVWETQNNPNATRIEPPTTEEKEDPPGVIEKLLATFVRSVAKILDNLVIGSIVKDVNERPYIDNIVFNKYEDTKLSFFDGTVGAKNDSNRVTSEMRDVVSKWYVAMRYVAMIGYLVAIFYIGIRILLTTVGKQRATYKELLQYWVTGLLILFTFHWIMAYMIWGNNVMVDMFSKASQAMVKSPQPLTKVFAETATAEKTLISAGLYLTIICMCVAFLVVYYKRLIVVAFLIMVFPLITISFVIDKIGDGKSQAWNHWFQEFSVNVIIQTFHAFLLCVLSSIALDSNLPAILRIISLAFLFPAEQIIRQIFGVNSSTSSNLAAGAAIGLGTLAAGKAAFSRLKNNAGMLASAGKEYMQGVIQDKNAEKGIGKKRTLEEKQAWQRSIAQKTAKGFTETLGAGFGSVTGTFAGIGLTGSMKGAVGGALAGAAIGDVVGEHAGNILGAGVIVGKTAYDLNKATKSGDIATLAGVNHDAATGDYKDGKIRSHKLTALASAAFGKTVGEFIGVTSSPDFGSFHTPEVGDKVVTDVYKDKSYTYTEKENADGTKERKLVSVGKGDLSIPSGIKKSCTFEVKEPGEFEPIIPPVAISNGFRDKATEIANREIGNRDSLIDEADIKKWDNAYNQTYRSLNSQYVSHASALRGSNTNWQLISNDSNSGPIPGTPPPSFAGSVTCDDMLNIPNIPQTYKEQVSGFIKASEGVAATRIAEATVVREITQQANDIFQHNPQYQNYVEGKPEGIAAYEQVVKECTQQRYNQIVETTSNEALRSYIKENPTYSSMVYSAADINDSTKYSYKSMEPELAAQQLEAGTPIMNIDLGDGTVARYDMTNCDSNGSGRLIGTVAGGAQTGKMTVTSGFIMDNGQYAESIKSVEVPPEQIRAYEGISSRTGYGKAGEIISAPQVFEGLNIKHGETVEAKTINGVEYIMSSTGDILSSQISYKPEGSKSTFKANTQGGNLMLENISGTTQVDSKDIQQLQSIAITDRWVGKTIGPAADRLQLLKDSLNPRVFKSVSDLNK